jgi:hypothetical protein
MPDCVRHQQPTTGACDKPPVVEGDRRLARCWTKLTGTPVAVTMWQPQTWRRGTWWAAA